MPTVPKWRADQYNFTHRFQFFERKLQPEREQQKRHADLGKQFDIMGVSHRDTTRIGANQHTGDDVPQNERLLQLMGEQSTEQRSNNDDDDVGGDTHEETCKDVTFGERCWTARP